MFAHEFMRNAYLAGTFIALACGVDRLLRRAPRAGLRRGRAQPRRLRRGAGAAALGIDIRLGLFAATLVVGAGHRRPRRARPRRRRRDRHRLRLDPRPRRALPLDLRQRLERRRRHRRGPRPLRLDPRPLRRRRPGRGGDRGRRLPGPRAIARPLLLASLDPEVARGLGVPVRAARASSSSSSSARSPPRRPRRSARSCCSACWRRPGGAARLLTDRPWLGLGLVGRDRGRLDVARSLPLLRDRLAPRRHRRDRRRHRRLPPRRHP